MRNVSDKRCSEKQNTHFLFNNFSFGNSAMCGRIWRSIVDTGRLQMAIWRMRIAWWISMVINKVKNVKFTLEQDTKTQRGSSSIALPFL